MGIMSLCPLEISQNSDSVTTQHFLRSLVKGGNFC